MRYIKILALFASCIASCKPGLEERLDKDLAFALKKHAECFYKATLSESNAKEWLLWSDSMEYYQIKYYTLYHLKFPNNEIPNSGNSR